MRKVLRFIEIVIVGLLLVAFVVSKVTFNAILDKDNLKLELKNADVYNKINKEIRKNATEELRNVFNKYPTISNKLDDMLDATLTDDILEKQTESVLDQFYKGKKNIEIDPNILVTGYKSNLDKYLVNNNINLPKEVDDKIDSMLDEIKINKIDISSYTDDFIPNFDTYVFLIRSAINLTLMVAVIIMGIAVCVSKEKFNVVYKPLLFAGIFLLIIRFGGIVVLNTIDYSSGENIKSVVLSVRNILFKGMDKYIIAFIVLGIGLLAVKLVINKRKRLN